MMNMNVAVAQVVALNGGEMVGKTRLQKVTYLLEEMGLGFDFDFGYHNFGPFSTELAHAVDDAVLLKYLAEDMRPGHHEVPYVVFQSTETAPKPENGELWDKREKALDTMKEYSALVLEVAATAVYLRGNGYPENFIEELKVRKPKKATPDRIKKAQALIVKLGL